MSMTKDALYNALINEGLSEDDASVLADAFSDSDEVEWYIEIPHLVSDTVNLIVIIFIDLNRRDTDLMIRIPIYMWCHSQVQKGTRQSILYLVMLLRSITDFETIVNRFDSMELNAIV